MKSNRREFIKKTSIALASLPLLKLLKAVSGLDHLFSSTAHATPAALPAGKVDIETAASAKAIVGALKYKKDIASLDAAAKKKRDGQAKDNPFCHNCTQYTQVNENWGSCKLFAMVKDGVVAKDGYCQSWSLLKK